MGFQKEKEINKTWRFLQSSKFHREGDLDHTKILPVQCFHFDLAHNRRDLHTRSAAKKNSINTKHKTPASFFQNTKKKKTCWPDQSQGVHSRGGQLRSTDEQGKRWTSSESIRLIHVMVDDNSLAGLRQNDEERAKIKTKGFRNGPLLTMGKLEPRGSRSPNWWLCPNV